MKDSVFSAKSNVWGEADLACVQLEASDHYD